METRAGVNFDRRIKARAKGKIYKMTMLTDTMAGRGAEDVKIFIGRDQNGQD